MSAIILSPKKMKSKKVPDLAKAYNLLKEETAKTDKCMHIYIHTCANSVRSWYILWRKIKPGKRPWGQFNYRLNGLPTSSGDDFWTKPEHRQWSDGASRDRPVGRAIQSEGRANAKAQRWKCAWHAPSTARRPVLLQHWGARLRAGGLEAGGRIIQGLGEQGKDYGFYSSGSGAPMG